MSDNPLADALEARAKAQDKPRSCPKCGSVNIVFDHWSSDDGTVRCKCEFGHGWDEWCETEQEAIEEWNKRAVEDLALAWIAEAVEDMKAECDSIRRRIEYGGAVSSKDHAKLNRLEALLARAGR